MNMHGFSRRFTFALAAVALLTLSFVQAGFAADYKIGFAFSMTGPAAAYGATQKNGAMLAVEKINAADKSGIKIVPLVEDDASTPQQGVNVYNKFINADKVSFIIGPTLSNTAKATNRIAQQSGVVVLAISNTAPGIVEVGDYIFRASLPESVVIPNTIKTMKDKLKISKVCVLYGNDDAFTKGGYEAFKKALADNKIQVISELTFAKGDRDFSPQLTQIKAKNPDAIIVSALVDEASGIVSQARRLGMKMPIAGGNGFNSPALIKNAGEAAEGVIVGAAWNSISQNPMNKQFVEEYTKKFGTPPDQFAAQAYAGVYIAYESIKTAGSPDNRKGIRDAMAKIRNLDTVLGKFSFDANREGVYEPVVQIIKGGKFDILK